jgi:hypothetical protein
MFSGQSAIIAGTIVLIFANIMDVYLTNQNIKTGKGSEANPIIDWAMKALPNSIWWLPKLVLIPPVIYFSFKYGFPIGTVLIWISALGYVYVCYRNFQVGR